jgi:hypothetical protein
MKACKKIFIISCVFFFFLLLHSEVLPMKLGDSPQPGSMESGSKTVDLENLSKTFREAVDQQGKAKSSNASSSKIQRIKISQKKADGAIPFEQKVQELKIKKLKERLPYL